MILQDNDPHHMHPDFNYVYYFLIIAVIFAVAMLFAAPKIMSYLDNRYERKKLVEKDSDTALDDEEKETK
jgi:flagellar biosynthesis/type III secretory pathway M-ring protein FliF/YscJ